MPASVRFLCIVGALVTGVVVAGCSCFVGVASGDASGEIDMANEADGAIVTRDAGVSDSDGGSAHDGGSARDAGTMRDGGPLSEGPSGCGFDAAAFCDTFDAPSSHQGRAGELDSQRWSAGRMHPQGVGANGVAVGVGMAVIPPCRSDMPAHVWPDDDMLICDPTDDVASHHLLVATAAQNYGQNGLRIRQPFDFASRTGKIVFDATVDPLGGLFGWLSLAVTEEPIAVPSSMGFFDTFQTPLETLVNVPWGNRFVDEHLRSATYDLTTYGNAVYRVGTTLGELWFTYGDSEALRAARCG